MQRIISAEKAIKARIRLAVLLHAKNQHQHVDDDAHIRCSVPYCHGKLNDSIRNSNKSVFSINWH